MNADDAELAELFYVEDSPIHGRGLFARIDLEEGHYLGEYQGPEARDVDTYVLFAQDESGDWRGRDGTNLLRYINHSNEPCAEFCGFELYALRAISAGTEITIDYGEDPAAAEDTTTAAQAIAI